MSRWNIALRCEYVIDCSIGSPTIESILVSWRDYADSDDEKLPAEVALVGTKLESHVAGANTNEFLATLLNAVMEQGQDCELPYRCDAPDKKRFMLMQISRLADKRLKLSHQLLSETSLPSTILFRLGSALEAEVCRCSFCCRIRHHRIWREPEEALCRKLLRSDVENSVEYMVCADCRTLGLRQFA